MRAALPSDVYGAARGPTTACELIDGDASADSQAESILIARVRAALEGRAPIIVVLCARGEPLLTARTQLHVLDQILAPLADEFGVRVSRSSTDGLAAWAAGSAPVGVDVQCAPAALEEGLLEAALHPQELAWFRTRLDPTNAFARLWAAKEAVLKAFGVGLAWSPHEVRVLPVTPGWHALHVPALGHAWFSHLDVPGTPHIALAVALNAGHTAPG